MTESEYITQLEGRSINMAYSEHPQHCLYLFQNSITIVVLRKYIGTVHNADRRNYTYQLSLVNHGKDDCGILTESFAMGEVVKQHIGVYQCFYFVHSFQRSSSSFSKSTPSGNLPKVIAITFADGL